MLSGTTDPGGAGTPPPGGTPSAPPPSPPAEDQSPTGDAASQDLQAPALRLKAAQEQSLDDHSRLVLVVRSPEAAVAELDARVVAAGSRRALRGAPRIDFREKQRALEPGEARRVRWRVEGQKLRRIRSLIRDGKRLESVFWGQATDTAGNASTTFRTRSRLRSQQ